MCDLGTCDLSINIVYLNLGVFSAGQCFLETDEGSPYIPVFSQIRWHHVVNDMSSISVLENDKILPTSKHFVLKCVRNVISSVSFDVLCFNFKNNYVKKKQFTKILKMF